MIPRANQEKTEHVVLNIFYHRSQKSVGAGCVIKLNLPKALICLWSSLITPVSIIVWDRMQPMSLWRW